MEENFTNALIVTAIGIYSIEKIITSLKARGIDLPRISRQINDLHDWHSAIDTDGVKKWYNKPRVEQTIANTYSELKAVKNEIKEIRRKLNEN